MLAQVADLRVCAFMSLRPCALMFLCPYVPVALCLRPFVLRPFACAALMSGFGITCTVVLS